MENKGVRFLAIDPSISKTGIAILRCSGDKKYEVEYLTSISTGTLKFPDKFAKKLAMCELFTFALQDRILDVSFAVFENYSFGSNGHLADLGEMNGLFKNFLSNHDMFFDVIPPSSVKKIVSGSGKASKKEVADATRGWLTHDIHYNNQDESDAVAVGIAYAEKIFGEIKA